MIENGEIFNNKGCPDDLIFGAFNDQPIPSDYFNFLNDDDEDDDDDDDGDEYDDGGEYDDDDDYDYINNIPVTPVYNALLDNKGVEDAVVPNDEDINDKIIIDDNDSLASDIEPIQNEIL